VPKRGEQEKLGPGFVRATLQWFRANEGHGTAVDLSSRTYYLTAATYRVVVKGSAVRPRDPSAPIILKPGTQIALIPDPNPRHLKNIPAQQWIVLSEIR